jgi:hypothetical protein
LDARSYAPPCHSMPPPWFGHAFVPESVGMVVVSPV